MNVQTANLFDIMRADLDRVEARVEQTARIDLPVVSAMVDDLIRAGGKRIRPLLLLLAGRPYESDPETLITAAAGVELLHTASLIHDDNIDRAALRRGKPTLNAQLSSGAVILIGDYLFAQSAMLAAATANTRVVAIFASTLGDICDGQLREMFDAHRLEQTREAYERRIYGKTAALFAGAAEMGAVIGQAPEHQIQALRAFGVDVGMAFQIMDDVLDLREGSQATGKPAGNDLRQGTVTLPMMLYAGSLRPDGTDYARLRDVISGDLDGDADVDAVVAAIRTSSAIDEAMEEARLFATRAKTRLDAVPDPDTRQMLVELTEMALWRSS